MQRAGHVVLATATRGDRVVDVGTGSLQAVDVAASTRRPARQLPAVMVVAVRDAVQRQRSVARVAQLPASAVLPGIHHYEDVLTLDAGAGLAGDETAPGSGQRSAT